MIKHFAVALLFAFLLTHLDGAPLLEDTIEKVFPLAPNEKLFLQAVDGGVFIYGSPRTDVKITATRQAFSPSRLNAIAIKTKKISEGIRVTTTVPAATPWHDHSGTVQYVIEVPQAMAGMKIDMRDGEMILDGLGQGPVEASLRHGHLTTRNCFCDQTIHAETGIIDIVYAWTEEDPVTVRVEIDDGNIFALLPGETSFHLRAQAPAGKVACEFGDADNHAGRSSLDESFGNAPRSLLDLRARAGNIRLSEIVW